MICNKSSFGGSYMRKKINEKNKPYLSIIFVILLACCFGLTGSAKINDPHPDLNTNEIWEEEPNNTKEQSTYFVPGEIRGTVVDTNLDYWKAFFGDFGISIHGFQSVAPGYLIEIFRGDGTYYITVDPADAIVDLPASGGGFYFFKITTSSTVDLDYTVRIACWETQDNSYFDIAPEIRSGAWYWGESSIDDFDYYQAKLAADTQVMFEFIFKEFDSSEVWEIDVYDESYVLIDSFVWYSWDVTQKFMQTTYRGWYYFRVHSTDVDLGQRYLTAIHFTPDTYLEWIAPDSGVVEFDPPPAADKADFEFTCSFGEIDKLDLYLNGVKYANNISFIGSPLTTTLTLDFSEFIDGTVTAELKGYQSAFEIVATRVFNFAKIIHSENETLQQGRNTTGAKLYSIIYDPNGDNSHSGFTSTSTFSLGVGSSIGVNFGLSVGVAADFGLFGGFEAGIDLKWNAEKKYDFRFEQTSMSDVTSSVIPHDASVIGPQRGDCYWGEVWVIPWRLMGTNNTYFNGTEKCVNPILYYGVNRSAHALLIEADAPKEWTDQNLHYLREHDPAKFAQYYGVAETDTASFSAGGIDSRSWEITTTESISHQFSFELNAYAKGRIGVGVFVTAGVEFGISTSVYTDSSQSTSLKRYYSMQDDDPGDFVFNDLGYDKRFGTYVFTTDSELCSTSNPLEYNTTDYQEPIISDPLIDLDTSGDSLGPCEDDEPLIIVPVDDEGGIKYVAVRYSIDNGLHWTNVNLTEQPGNPGTWAGQLPSQEHGTTVLWYVRAKDLTDHIADKKDDFGFPFEYLVLNRNPVVLVLSPNGMEHFTDDEILLTWSGSDPDNDALTYTLAYNLDNQGWHLLATGITDEFYLWDISSYDSDHSVLIRVIADDSFGGTDYDESDWSFYIDHEQSTPTPTPTPTSPVTTPSDTTTPKTAIGLLVPVISFAVAIPIIILKRRKKKEY